jgi:light-regulated signal transduction histidine kinase (bacteriophytochrome)/CheY-like chemotaxis protein
LLACDETFTITHVTANAPAFLPVDDPSKLLGTPLSDVLGATLLHKLERVRVDQSGDVIIPARVFEAKVKGGKARVNVAMHTYAGSRIVEIEPAGDDASVAPLDLVRVILGRLQQARNLKDLCNETAKELRTLIGFDRVMIYRFLHDGAGQVIAESRRPDLESLLDLRYPASDIPAQARVLYTKNWVRLISDVAARTVPILAAPGHAEPLDLSYADLRSVSLSHTEYLFNMGVAASMSISIIVGGELWGLITCHHTSPRLVGANIRAAAELVGQVFSMQIQAVESIEAYVTMRAGRLLVDRVIAELPVGGDLLENLAARLDQLAAFMPCDGVGVLVNNTFRGTGVNPTPGEVIALARYMDQEDAGRVFATHHLAAEFDLAAIWPCEICGLLGVPLSHEPGNWLFFFRGAVAQTIRWGGNPDKVVSVTDGRISPRKSFEVWVSEVRGQSLPWTSRERIIGDTLRVYLLDIIVRFSEVIREERRQADVRQRLLTNELNHRVRGTLELIQSLVVHGYEEPAQVQRFVRALEGRIRAIALAHDATSVAHGSDIRALVERTLALQSTQASQCAIEIQGPAVLVDAKAYTVLALVLHELVTRAADAGALSTASGKLSVKWYLDGSGRPVILWEEAGGRGGRTADDSLGLAIIKRNVPHALGGEAKLELNDDGVRASFVIPARYVVNASPIEAVREQRAQLAPPPRPLEGYSILAVEQQMPSAIDLEHILQERGASSIRIVGTAEAALEALAAEAPDVALLDLDLGDEEAMVVADALTARSIPFLLAASHSDQGLVPAKYRDAPFVPKPYVADTLVELLKEALLTRLIQAVLTRLV